MQQDTLKKAQLVGFIALTFSLAVMTIVGSLSMLTIGFDKTEVVECNTWKQQAKEYPNFYMLQWQRDQCDAHNIWIGAPVK
jgi:hypothetical protein